MENMSNFMRFGHGKPCTDGKGHGAAEGFKRVRCSAFYAFAIVGLVVSVLAATACNMRFEFKAEPNSTALYERVSDAVGLNIPYGNMKLKIDSHGWFGDGTTFAVARLTPEAEDVIKQSKAWHSFPLSDTAEKIIYGKEESGGSVGPFLNDDNGEPLFPRVEHGYYIITDRFDAQNGGKDKAGASAAKEPADPEAAILERASLNITIALFDADTCTLYYAELDT